MNVLDSDETGKLGVAIFALLQAHAGAGDEAVFVLTAFENGRRVTVSNCHLPILKKMLRRTLETIDKAQRSFAVVEYVETKT